MKPAKTYYIGDLCYVMNDAWDEVCNLTFPCIGEEREGRIVLGDGRQIFIFGTAYGDGEYKDQFGNTYGVDSGTLGAIRVEDIRDGENSKETLEELGCFHTFDQPLTDDDCCSENGVVSFGHIHIDTNRSPLYENEDDDEEYLDEDWYGDDEDEDD